MQRITILLQFTLQSEHIKRDYSKHISYNKDEPTHLNSSAQSTVNAYIQLRLVIYGTYDLFV